MGQAILDGVLNSNLFRAERITVLEKKDSFESLKNKQIYLTQNFDELLERSEMILICVKPQIFPELSGNFQKYQGTTKTLVSIMAGLSVSKMKSLVGSRFEVIRTMPNLPLFVQQGMTVISKDPTLEVKIKQVQELFSCCGKVIQVEEKDMAIITALSGSGPALVFQFLESQTQAALQENLSLETARVLIEQTLLGALKVVQSQDLSLSEWITKVCSKGGTTIAALEVMEKLGFSESIKKGIQAATNRSREMDQ